MSSIFLEILDILTVMGFSPCLRKEDYMVYLACHKIQMVCLFQHPAWIIGTS